MKQLAPAWMQASDTPTDNTFEMMPPFKRKFCGLRNQFSDSSWSRPMSAGFIADAGEPIRGLDALLHVWRVLRQEFIRE